MMVGVLYLFSKIGGASWRSVEMSIWWRFPEAYFVHHKNIEQEKKMNESLNNAWSLLKERIQSTSPCYHLTKKEPRCEFFSLPLSFILLFVVGVWIHVCLNAVFYIPVFMSVSKSICVCPQKGTLLCTLNSPESITWGRNERLFIALFKMV